MTAPATGQGGDYGARMVDVRRADETDVELVGAVAGAAFETDPLMGWVFPDPATRPSLLALVMTGLARSYLPEGGDVYLADAACVALWRRPDHDHHPDPEPDPEADGAAGADDAERPPNPIPVDSLERLAIMSAAMSAAHPHEPHWYLNVLGTRPEHQGQGLGGLVLAPVLEICDREGMRAYLESSNARNMPFYFRHGFVQSGEIELPDGPSLHPMWREPR